MFVIKLLIPFNDCLWKSVKLVKNGGKVKEHGENGGNGEK